MTPTDLAVMLFVPMVSIYVYCSILNLNLLRSEENRAILITFLITLALLGVYVLVRG